MYLVEFIKSNTPFDKDDNWLNLLGLMTKLQIRRQWDELRISLLLFQLRDPIKIRHKWHVSDTSIPNLT